MKVFSAAVIIFWHFSLAACVLGNELHRLVQDLEDRIKARTTVYYDLFESPSIEGLLQNSRVPNIVIREDVKFELKTHFNSQILAVVFIESRINNDLMNTLRRALNNWYGTDMLFVAEDLLSETTWKWLFDWCWSSGFYNVLLVSLQQPTKLLTFNKFPRVQIKSTTIAIYFEQRNVWRDFHGYQIRAGVGNTPPRSIIYKNRSTGETVFSGTFYQAMQLFAERHHATLAPVTLQDISTCLSSLGDTVDVCLHGAALQANQRYELAVVPRTFSFYILVPFARPLKKYEYFLLPFDLQTWIGILLAVGFIAVAISLLRWRDVGVWDLSGSLLTSFSSMLYLEFRLRRTTSRSKFLIYTIMIASGFIISNLYLAKLSSFLSSNVYEKQIESVADLLEKNVTVLISPYLAQILSNVALPEELWKHIKIVDSDSYFSHQFALNPEYAYICEGDLCSFMLHQQILITRPKLKLISQELVTTLASFPLAISWPLKEAYNDFYLNVWSTGFYGVIARRFHEEAIKAGLITMYRTEVEEARKPYSMEDFQVLLIIFAIGYSAALLVFCMEILIFYFSKHRSRRQ